MGQAAFERLPVLPCEVIPGCRSPPARLSHQFTTRACYGLKAGDHLTRNNSSSHRVTSSDRCLRNASWTREPATSAAIRRSLLLLYFSGSTQPSYSYCSTGPAYVIGSTSSPFISSNLCLASTHPPSLLTLTSSTTYLLLRPGAAPIAGAETA